LLIGINIREYRRINQKWTFYRYWQHWVHNTKKSKTKQKHNTIWCWTPLYANKYNQRK